jgi:Heavy metal binding domain
MKKLLALLATGLLLAPAAYAQHDHAAHGATHGAAQAGESHAHKAPHGGMVRTAGDYHIEVVAAPGQLTVYLLDGKEGITANKGVTGTATVQTTDNKSATVTLTPAGDEHFVAKLADGATARTAVISFQVKGKSVSAIFDKLAAAEAKGAGKATGAAYICPMKCEGSASDKPGACPKCGMALVKQ